MRALASAIRAKVLSNLGCFSQDESGLAQLRISNNLNTPWNAILLYVVGFQYVA